VEIELLTHLRNDTLDLALLLPADSFRALENVCFMRHAANKLSVIFRTIGAHVNYILDQVSKRTSHCIGRGVSNARVDTIDGYRLRKVAAGAFINVICYTVTIGIQRHYYLSTC